MTTPTRAQLLERLRQEAPQAVRIVVAAAVGWQICRWIDPGSLPIYAVIVPVVAMRDDPYSAFNTSFDRLLGVLAGITIGVLVAGWLGPSVYAVSLVLLVGLLGGIVLRVGPSLNVQVSMSALLVFASPDPGQLAVVRLWETLVGAAVTVVPSPLLFPPTRGRPSRGPTRRSRVRWPGSSPTSGPSRPTPTGTSNGCSPCTTPRRRRSTRPRSCPSSWPGRNGRRHELAAHRGGRVGPGDRGLVVAAVVDDALHEGGRR